VLNVSPSEAVVGAERVVRRNRLCHQIGPLRTDAVVDS